MHNEDIIDEGLFGDNTMFSPLLAPLLRSIGSIAFLLMICKVIFLSIRVVNNVRYWISSFQDREVLGYFFIISDFIFTFIWILFSIWLILHLSKLSRLTRNMDDDYILGQWDRICSHTKDILRIIGLMAILSLVRSLSNLFIIPFLNF